MLGELTIGSVRRSSCERYSPVICPPRSVAEPKKFRMKVRAPVVSEFGRKGRSRNGRSSARFISSRYIVCQWTRIDRHTSRLHLLRASSHQFLDILRFNLRLQPGILPQRLLRLQSTSVDRVSRFLSLRRWHRAITVLEDLREERHPGCRSSKSNEPGFDDGMEGRKEGPTVVGC